MLPVVVGQSTVFQYPLGILLFLISIFLILLILVQRGRGGGLTGALGGMGGQSAFGSKAGDIFTRITVITAAVWIFLCLVVIAIYDESGFAPTTGGGRRAANRSDDNAQVLPPEADRDTASPPADAATNASEAGRLLNSGNTATDTDTGAATSNDDAAPADTDPQP